MAVQPQTPYKEYTANGSTKSFALEFDCDNQDHLIVLVDDVEEIVGTWSLSNGAVVFGNAPTSGKKITIQRNTPFRRDGDFQSYDNSFRPGPVNKGFDWIWLKLQELGVADWILSTRINDLRAYVERQDSVLQENIDNLKTYVDDRDDELRSYLLEEIRKQGVALDQLDEYYNYLMERLAQIAVDKGWDASFVVDGNLTQHERNIGIMSLSQLRLTNPSKKWERVYLASVNGDQGEGGGDFIATQKSGLIDNGGTIVSSPKPNMFWVRKDQTILTPEMFGATKEAAHKSIQKMLDLEFPVTLGQGVYKLNYPLVLNTNSVIKGQGTDKSILRKISNNKVTGFDISRTVTFPVIGGGGATYSIDVDGILVSAPKDYSANYNYYMQLENFTCDRELTDDLTNYMVHHNSSFVDTGYGKYGWFFPYLCQSTFKNTRCFNNEYGIYTVNSWMNTFERVQWRASNGVVFGGLDGDVNRGGTSTNLTDCWVTDVMGGADHWAWRIHNMDYSNWSSCGTDFVGKEGETPADGVLLVTSGTTGADTTLTISGFGSEVVHAKQYLKASGKLTLEGSSWTAVDWFNKYGTQSTYLFEATEEAKVKISLPNFKFMHAVDNPAAPYYADQPKFAIASWGSTLEFEHPKIFPKVTGKNDVGRFGIQALQSSTVRIKTRTSDLVAVAGTDDDALENASDHNKFITNQGIQSDSTSIDSGMVAPTACRWDTNQLRLGNQYLWYSPTYDKWLYSTVKPISETSGSVLGDDSLAGSTANRPTTYPLRRTGGCYFDQTIGKPIWWDGSVWKDANGANA